MRKQAARIELALKKPLGIKETPEQVERALLVSGIIAAILGVILIARYFV